MPLIALSIASAGGFRCELMPKFCAKEPSTSAKES